MSKGGRTLLSRPRTKVYDTNYDIGQSYYKSALDGLDRKYGRSTSSAEPSTNGGLAALRASLDRERESQKEMSAVSRAMKNTEDDFMSEIPRRRAKASALMDEFDSIFDSRVKNGIPKEREPTRAVRAIEDDDEEFEASLRKMRATARAKAAAAVEDFEDISSLSSSKTSATSRAKLDFSDKLIESVGISGRARAALEEEGQTSKRRALKIASSLSEADDEGSMTRWTAIKDKSSRRHVLDDFEEDSAASLAAAARAKQSRARLEDLEAEMQALADRGAAREKRVRDLKALVQENESSTKEQIQSAVRVKTTIKEKKVVSTR